MVHYKLLEYTVTSKDMWAGFRGNRPWKWTKLTEVWQISMAINIAVEGCLWTGRSNVGKADECCWSYVSAHKVSTQFHIHVYKAIETNFLSVVRISSRNFTIMRSAIILTVIPDYLNIPRKLKSANLMCHLSSFWWRLLLLFKQCAFKKIN